MSKKIKKRTFKRTIITGTFLILPLFITIGVVRFILSYIDSAVKPIIEYLIQLAEQDWILETSWIKYIIPIVSILLLIILIWIIGLVGSNVLGKQIFNIFDKLLQSIPFISTIYSSVKQFLDTFSSDNNSFRKVVIVEYPRCGMWTLALLTNDLTGEIKNKLKHDMVAVFIPTTPNPTSGWLLFVPVKDVIELDMSIDDAFKMIISGGIITPSWNGNVALQKEIKSN